MRTEKVKQSEQSYFELFCEQGMAHDEMRGISFKQATAYFSARPTDLTNPQKLALEKWNNALIALHDKLQQQFGSADIAHIFHKASVETLAKCFVVPEEIQSQNIELVRNKITTEGSPNKSLRILGYAEIKLYGTILRKGRIFGEDGTIFWNDLFGTIIVVQSIRYVLENDYKIDWKDAEEYLMAEQTSQMADLVDCLFRERKTREETPWAYGEM